MKPTSSPLLRRDFVRQACCSAVGTTGILSALARRSPRPPSAWSFGPAGVAPAGGPPPPAFPPRGAPAARLSHPPRGRGTLTLQSSLFSLPQRRNQRRQPTRHAPLQKSTRLP